jgi:hypothetical protein
MRVPTILDVVVVLRPIVLGIRRVWTFVVGPPAEDTDAS